MIRLSNDDPMAEKIDEDVVATLLEAATAEINAAFEDGGLKLPLSYAPPVVTELCAILTRCRLYSRRPEGMEFPPAVLNACQAARQTLKDIAAGKLTLGAKGADEDTPDGNYIGGRAKTTAPYSLMQDFVDYAWTGGPTIRENLSSTSSAETISNFYTKSEVDALLAKNKEENNAAIAKAFGAAV